MLGLGLTLIIVGILSFILPVFSRQFVLVSALGITGMGTAVAGFIFIGLGIILSLIGSSKTNNKSKDISANAQSSELAPKNSSLEIVRAIDLSSNRKQKDQWFIHETEILLTPLAHAIDIKAMAADIVRSTKEELAAVKNIDLYSEHIGDRLVATPSEMLSKRLAAGLTREDIRLYWNQPPLMQRIQTRVQDFVLLMIIKKAEESRLDVTDVLRTRRKTTLWLGDPDTWDPSKPINYGFTEKDADIYPEFTMRIGIWTNAVQVADRTRLLAQQTSFNAMIRNQINQGLL